LEASDRGTAKKEIDCVFLRLTNSLGVTLSKEVCKRQEGVKYSLCFNIKQNIPLF
jgi:hypothetical protein